MYDIVELCRLTLRLWHAREFAEAADDRFQIIHFGQQRRRSLAEYFFKQLGCFFLGADQILDCDLQRKEGIL